MTSDPQTITGNTRLMVCVLYFSSRDLTSFLSSKLNKVQFRVFFKVFIK